MRNLLKPAAFVIVGALLGAGFAHQSTKPPVIQAGLTNVVVATSNIDAESAFYQNTFGFRSFFKNKTCCFLKAGGVNLVFIVCKDKAHATREICLDVSVKDVAGALAALTQSGLKVDSTDPAVLKVSDPDGNIVEVVHG